MSKNYTFTRDQLYSMLQGTIEMYLEYRKKHGQTTLQAKTSAALEVIEGIDADQNLVNWDVTEKTLMQVPPANQREVILNFICSCYSPTSSVCMVHDCVG